MTNKGKRNLYLVLLILVLISYILIILFKTIYDLDVKWWTYCTTALLIVGLLGAYRNFSQAVKEDKKYGPIE